MIGNITSTSSGDSEGELPDIAGKNVQELLSRWPLGENFSIVQFETGEASYTAAVRRDSDTSVLVYYLNTDDSGLFNPTVPFIRLMPERVLPIVSPGFVALLGYTPWELSQSDFFTSLPSGDSHGHVTLLDRGGRGHRLIFSRQKNTLGGWDYSFIRQPEGLVFPVQELQRLSSMDVRGTEDLLAFIVDVLELESAVIMTRSPYGYVPMSLYNIDIDTEHFETSSLFSSTTIDYPLWVDLDDTDSPLGLTGQCLVYPQDNLLLVAPWRGDADRLQRRADAIMPAVSMRYEQYRVTHGEHRIQTLLKELDIQITDQADTHSLERVLSMAAMGYSASLMAIFGPEESALPIAVSRTDSELRNLLVSDRPFEECFNDTHVSVLRDGFILLTAWNDERDVPYSAVDAFGRILDKLDLASIGMPESELPDFSTLTAVLMNDTRVIWRGKSLGISNCYQFYGYTRQCADCPLEHLSADGNRSARLENHQGYIEEIHPAQNGFIVTWTRLPEDKDASATETKTEPFPGGTARYSSDGEILQWKGWFQEATGIGSSQAEGQNGARLLDRIEAPAVLAQFRSALSGDFIPEPVEFIWRGMKCFSRMVSAASSDSIRHTVLDSNRAGIATISSPAPGVIIPSSDPGSLAEYLSTACRREGWEFDVSGQTAEDGANIWFSREVMTDLLAGLLHILTPMCPDRWTGLETGWLDSNPDTGAFSFLPGRYHVLRFSLHGMQFKEQSSTLEKLSILFQSFGGWLAGSPGQEVLQVGLPAARECFKDHDAIIFSPFSEFIDECREILSDMSSRKFIFTDSAKEMAAEQQTAGAVICRLDQSTIQYATALWARLPRQPVLVASGLSSGLPPITSSVRHLQLPADRKSIYSAIRKTVRG